MIEKDKLSFYPIVSIRGFTLIEMMVVLTIMVLLLSVLVFPSMYSKNAKKQVNESLELMDSFKADISQQYQVTSTLPKSNAQAGMPMPQKILGNYLVSAQVDNGVITLLFGNKADGSIKDKRLSLLPIIVADSPDSPMSWVCGYDPVPNGMIASGTNKTNIDPKFLPSQCN